MTPTPARSYEVCGLSKSGRTFVMRAFRQEADAIAHALAADMTAWDDVFVRPSKKVTPPTDDGKLPTFPWSVLWIGGYAYLIDAEGRKIATLYGTQRQRELMAEFLIDATTVTT